MAAKPGAMRTNVFGALLWWGLDIACLICVFAAYGYIPHLSWVLMSYSVAYTVATFVPTPGGLGTVEAILIALFTGFGVHGDVTVASVLVYRLINFWLPIPFGTVAYLTVRRGGKETAPA